MEKSKIIFVFSIAILFSIMPSILAAHFIIGITNDANDGELANGKTVVLWNPANGLSDNLTDTVGPSGNSGASNIYMIDCELLSTPCNLGDEIRTQVIDNGDGYFSTYVNTSVSGAGFDIMSNLTLNSPPTFTTIILDDEFSTPTGEIDLLPFSTKQVTCEGIIYEYDGNETLDNITAELFDNSQSFFGDTDDNNDHYTNNTCSLNLGYGNEYESYFNCSFQIEYYANSNNWNCTLTATDNLSVSTQENNISFINPLLALSIPSPIDFGVINSSYVGSESELNITNAGNVLVNLSLSGYGSYFSDGNAMNCTQGNISIEYERFNLTASNPGVLNLTEFESLYKNLTSNPQVNEFNLASRQNDSAPYIDDTNNTYWRIYAPGGIGGTCSGNIVFGAVQQGV